MAVLTVSCHRNRSRAPPCLWRARHLPTYKTPGLNGIPKNGLISSFQDAVQARRFFLACRLINRNDP